ncbi:MAG TPA: DUF58 domain-containing protein [Acidimicrobiales bacterium]
MSASVGQGRRYLRLRPPGVALLCLAALAIVFWLFSRTGLHLLLAVALAVAVVIDAATALAALATPVVHVGGPGAVVAGRPTTWTLQVEGVRRPLIVAPCRRPRSDEVRVVDDGPGLVTFPALARGVAQSLLLDVTATGPAGLFECGRRCRVVLPAPVFVGPPPLAHQIDWPSPRAVGFATSEVAPIGDDLFRSVRTYVRGDPRRSIHWKATAHHGHLMVRESDGTGVVVLRIVVHLPPPGDIADLTAARAAYLAEEALRRGWLVHLVTAAPREILAEPTVPLRSPFGSPPVVPPRPASEVHVVDRRVRSGEDVLRVLAVASAGSPGAPRGPGLTCVVTPTGTEWR